LSRDPARIRRDIWNGKISREYASERHGLQLDKQEDSPVS
jgi:N-methylhydantoinase B/oxoprolinase/acetone carboxylase alpha subunit